MKEAQVAKGLAVTIKDIPVPEPEAEQVVIKVVVSGSNPKDWYVSSSSVSSNYSVSHTYFYTLHYSNKQTST
jgi:NADPH:quinone reductase-like Zn-dependent oxidoreductase